MANVGQFTASCQEMGEVVSVERKASFDLLGQVGTCFKLYGRIDFETALLFCLNCCDWYSGDSAGGLRDVGRLQIRGLRSEDQMQGSTADFRIQTIWRAAHVLNSTGCTPRGLHRLQHSCQWHMSDSDTVRFGGS